MATSAAVQIARLDERLKSIEALLGSIAADQKTASESRRRGFEAQERTEREMIGINHRLTAVEQSVRDMKPTTADVEKMRERAIGAGTLGVWLWRLGGMVLAAAAGAAAAWTALTGRPPP